MGVAAFSIVNQMTKEHTKISKFLSFVLRHNPQSIGIELDENGWADIAALIDRTQKFALSQELIAEVVRTNDKQRFALSKDGLKIRASQGHSIKIDLEYKAVTPPDILYHGTASRFLASIMKQGLTRQNRQHVHLSADIDTAQKVGSRHGTPVILTIAARELHQFGQAFYLSDNKVWLTEKVSVRALSREG